MAIFSTLLFTLSTLLVVSFGNPQPHKKLEQNRHVRRHTKEDTSGTSTSPSNIILIMVDDLGRSDIGAFGAEWETPNLDSFISDSVTLSHHYIGYVCSASRSQFLTGRYSYHMGYGELDVFDLGKSAGFIPKGSPTIAEYLKHFSNYQTYAVGKWQLGSSSKSQIAVGRGFDSFWGFNGGMEEYNSKIRDWTGEEDNSFVDFYTNDEPTSEASGEYSTDQYYAKAVSYMEQHYEDETTQDKPFFIYLALQAIHGPFTESDGAGTSDYELYCEETYSDSFDNWKNRQQVCGAIVGIDTMLGTFLDEFKTNSILTDNNVWENTMIVLTSDNGGSLDKGSCNYPLRGGKNTFHEGGQRVLAVVGGGVLPDTQRGKVLDGLVSNVDWVPTFLSFANLMPTDYKHVTLGESDSELPMVLDGYNLYPYIMGEDDSWIRDHLIFHMKPQLKNTMVWEYDDISDYSMDDMEEFALIFYDKNGNLWKYLDVDISSNIIGDPVTNAGFCEKLSDDAFYHTDTTEDDVVYNGIFNLNTDKRERHNIESLDKTGEEDHLTKVMKERLNFYTNTNGKGSQSATYLYGHFSCLLRKTDDIKNDCFDAADDAQAWVTFYDDDQVADSIFDVCDALKESHTIYKLMTTSFEFPTISDESDGEEEFLNYITDNTANIKKLNYLAPKTKSRTFEKGMVLDLEKVWPEGEIGEQKIAVDSDEEILNENNGISSQMINEPKFNSIVNASVGIFVLGLIAVIVCVGRNLKQNAKINSHYIELP